jgi:hypothetical protein
MIQLLIFNVLLAQFSIKETNAENMVIEFKQDEPTYETSGDYVKLSSSNKGTTTDYGQPELPLFSTLIQIKSDREYFVTFNILSSHVKSDIMVFPFQNKHKTEAPGLINFTDESFYNQEALYPESILKVSDRLIMRDLNLLNISVVPYRYYPASRTLEVIDELEIEVSEIGERDNEDVQNRLPSRVFEKLYSTLVLNYEEHNRQEEFQDPAILYICGGNSESNSYFQQLVDWRHQRGYTVYTASLNETGNSSSSIKNYIQNAYNNFNPPPEYVALVGDVGGSYSVPTFYEDWGHDYWGDACEGDQPFSQLDGNDLFPEVIVGRISVRSSSNISNIVNKIIHYEKATYLGNLNGFYERAAVIGDPGDSGLSTIITSHYVEEIMTAFGVEDVNLKTSGSSWVSWMENQLEDGVLYFQYRGFYGVSGFDNGDIDDANNGHKLPFATVLTCGTGSFAEENTCLSEQFLKAGSLSNPRGAVAAVSTATGNTHTMFNNIIAMGMYDGLFPRKVGTAGASLVNGKLTLFNAYPNNPYNWVNAFCQWNSLMGDPATHLWTDTPKLLYVNFDDSIPFGTNFLDVEVLDQLGDPVSDAMVTVLKGDDEIFINSITDENGQVSIPLQYEYGGDVSLTVTKMNCKPYIGTFNISTVGTLVNLDTQASINIEDGDDGQLNPGETIDFFIPIRNYGLLNANEVVAHISTESPFVEIIDDHSFYGTVSAGNSNYGDSFTIHLSESAMEREDILFQLDIEDMYQSNWNSIMNLNSFGTLISVTDYSVSGASTLDPGVVSDMKIVLSNNGSIETEELTGTLVPLSPGFQIINSVCTWNSINPDESVENQDWFTVKPSSDLIPGTMVNLRLNLETENGFNRNMNFTTQVGSVTITDPLGPDNYGYYIYDSEDENYSMLPTYDWIEISYIGNNLDIYDVGAGRGICSENNSVLCHSDADCDPWGGAWYGYCEFEETTKDVSLPFLFQYYGESYTSISVSSNGWIAFGDSDLESFRNYPVPGAGGPSPMLAVFWDDLKTSNGGDVFTYAHPGNDFFIIEWSNVRTENYNSLNSFQAILYNETSPPYDDNDIKLQYKTFNNTSSGSFAGYTPIHGGYATIGLENYTSEIGLIYSFNNDYPTAAMELDDQTALFITTRPNGDFSEVTLTVPFMDDWNLIGLPVMVENGDYLMMFPDAIEHTLFSFQGSYNNEEILNPGHGYWLRFNTSGSTNITGGSLLDMGTNLNEGWNLVSGISQTVSLNSVNDPDEILITGTLYGYGDLGYEESWNLEPGKGYWLRSHEDGTIYFTSGRSQRNTNLRDETTSFSWISLNGRKLFMDYSISVDEAIHFSLPPKPPVGGRDIRFSGDTKLCTTDDCKIEVMNPTNELFISYQINPTSSEDEWTLITEKTGEKFELYGTGTLNIYGDISELVLRKSVTSQIPTVCTLLHAHPNPFNPVTIISFSLSTQETQHDVSLQVYDITGKWVKTLVDKPLSPGNHSVQWNASEFSSGVYFLKLESSHLSQVEKLMLIK